jgi:predicted secreted hydrolase
MRDRTQSDAVGRLLPADWRRGIRARHAWLFGLLAAAALAWLLWPKSDEPLRARVVAAAVAETDGSFTRVEGPRPLRFPVDHGPHDDFQTEWWYYTGNLRAATGESFGYQLTFFRRALAPPDRQAERDSRWGAEQVFMAHFALTDVSGGGHYSAERFARSAAGLAGAQATPFRVWLEDWAASGATAGQARLRASTTDPASGLDLSLDLRLTDLKGAVLQGDRGYSQKGPEPGNASIYYSLPRIDSVGEIRIGSRTFAVSGLSWMDHEYGTSALGPELTGWDWFSLQLSDGSEVMLYALRRIDGSRDSFSSGTLIAPDGSARALTSDEFSIQATGQWRSPRTGGAYPAGWIVTVPRADLRLTVTPLLADQEMRTSLPYWEGAVRVSGTRSAQAVTGNGYVELTGYAASLQSQF